MRLHSKVLMPVTLLLAAGCTTMGTGVGSTPAGTDPVRFSWQSTDGVSGTMRATLADGSVYAGSYFQITSDTRVDTLEPLWVGWGPGWGGAGRWNYWDASPEFVTRYSGRVVANLTDLQSVQGQHIRCRFRLIHPDSGMAGGGQGECQLPDGNTIDASFP